MKKWMIAILTVVFISLGTFTNVEATAKDGRYQVGYTVYQGDSNSVSMANDYFNKPATVTVKGGTYSVELTLNHSKWITALWLNGQKETLVSQNKAKDIRTVRFDLKQIDGYVPSQIKVDIDDNNLNYHHTYKIRTKFETSALQAANAAAAKSADKAASPQSEENGTHAAAADKETAATAKEANPKSGDNASYLLYGTLVIIAGGALLWLRKTAKA